MRSGERKYRLAADFLPEISVRQSENKCAGIRMYKKAALRLAKRGRIAKYFR